MESGCSYRTDYTSIYCLPVYKYIVIAIIISILNTLFCTNYYISFIIVIGEITALGYCLLKRKYTEYACLYLIFLTLSLEHSFLVGSDAFYGFKNFRIAGVNIAFVCFIPMIIRALIDKHWLCAVRKKAQNELDKFLRLILLMSAAGLVMGIINIIINDNNIQGINNILWVFLERVYTYIGMVTLPIMVFYFVLKNDKGAVNKLKETLYGILIAIVIGQFASLLFGKTGHHGDSTTLLVTTAAFYIPFLIIFLFYKNYYYRKITFIAGFFGALISVYFNPSGKALIVVVLLPVLLFLLLLKRKNKRGLLIYCGAVTIFLLIGGVFLFKLMETNSLFSYKLYQVESMVSFWKKGWWENMASSPKWRIVEFIDILIEYAKKPWMFIFGKGFMGSILDHTGYFMQRGASRSAFSLIQWENGTFFSVHETLNVFFLINGLTGLAMIFYIIKTNLKHMEKTPYIIIGSVWFLLFVGYSLTLAYFGIACLLVGFYDIDCHIRRNTKKEKMMRDESSSLGF